MSIRTNIKELVAQNILKQSDEENRLLPADGYLIIYQGETMVQVEALSTRTLILTRSSQGLIEYVVSNPFEVLIYRELDGEALV